MPCLAVGAGGVEIAQGDVAEAGIGGGRVAQQHFADQLGAAVGIDGQQRRLLVDRHRFRHAVDGGGGRENEVLHVVRQAGLEQAQAVERIVLIVFQRQADRFAHLDEGGKMHDGANGVTAQQRADQLRVGDVAADQFAVQHGFRLARGEVVQDDRVIALLSEVAHHMRADIAGPAGDQDGLAGGGRFLVAHGTSI